MPSTPLQPHYKNARAGKQVFLPPPPPRIVPLPVPVRSPSMPPIAPVRDVLTPKTGMTRNELNERFADIRAAIAERFENIRRITGYLTGTLDKWNNAKRAEERDRVKHAVANEGAGEAGNDGPAVGGNEGTAGGRNDGAACGRNEE